MPNRPKIAHIYYKVRYSKYFLDMNVSLFLYVKMKTASLFLYVKMKIATSPLALEIFPAFQV